MPEAEAEPEGTSYAIICSVQLPIVLISLVVVLCTILIIARYSALHGNCKAFLLLNTAGMLFILCSHFGKVIIFLRIDHHTEAFLFSYTPFMVLHPLTEFGYFLCSCSTVVLIIERIVACWLLDRYDQSPCSWTCITVGSFVCIAFASYFSYLVHYRRLVVQATIIGYSVGLVALIMLVVCYRYSRWRYRTLTNISSRYQMREVQEVTRALIPASTLTILSRFCAGVFFVAKLVWPEYMPYIYGISLFQTIHSLNTVQWCAILVLKHRGLRQTAINLLPGQSEYEPASKIPRIDAASSDVRSRQYFRELETSWA